MATLAALTRQERNRGGGRVGSLTSAIGKKTGEKLDPRNYMFDREGLIAALFPSLRGYKPRTYRQGYTGDGVGQRSTQKAIGGLAAKIDVVARNSLYLPSMARDMNIIRRNIVKLTKVAGVKPSTKPDEHFKQAQANEGMYESQFNKKSPTKTEEGGKPKESSGMGALGWGLVIGGIVTGLAKYFTDPEFKAKVNGMVDSFGATVFGSETWNNLKTTITNGFEDILEDSKNFISDIIEDYWKEISVAILALGALVNPIGAITGAFTALEMGLKGLLAIFSNPIFVSALAGLGITAAAGGGMLDSGQLAAKAARGEKLTDEETSRLQNYAAIPEANMWEEEPADQHKRLTEQIASKKKDIEAKEKNVKDWEDTQDYGSLKNLENDKKELEDMEFRRNQIDLNPKPALQPPTTTLPPAPAPEAQKKEDTGFFSGMFKGRTDEEKSAARAKRDEEKKARRMARDAQQTSTSPSKAGASGGDKVQTATQYLMAKGWTKEQASGIVGNLLEESGLNTQALNKNENAQGIAQWRNERVKNFEARYGKSIKDASLEEQLDFVDYELRTTEKKAGDKLKETTSAADAAFAFNKHYERSADKLATSRINKAQGVFAGTSGESAIPSQIPSELGKPATPKEALVAANAAIPANLSGDDSMKQFFGGILGAGTEQLMRAKEIMATPPQPIINQQKTIAQGGQQSPAPNREILDVDISKLVLNVA